MRIAKISSYSMNFDFFGAGETKDQEIEKKGGEIQALTSTLETAKVYLFAFQNGSFVRKKWPFLKLILLCQVEIMGKEEQLKAREQELCEVMDTVRDDLMQKKTGV